RLAPTRRPHNGHEFPWFNDETNIFKDKRLRLGILEEHVSELDPALDLPRIGQELIMPALERAQGDVSQALEVQFENAEVKRLFHQLDGLLAKVLFVAHEREDHANCQTVVQC